MPWSSILLNVGMLCCLQNIGAPSVSSRRIEFAFLRPGVEDFKASVGMGRHLETMGCIGTFGIGDELCRDVVRRAALFGKMQLPEVFQPGRFLNDVPDRRAAALPGAVVHDGHAGRDAVSQRGAAALRPAMM